MQHQVMGYDRSATMFSPDGHILQVEYAEKTVKLGTASIGISCSDGVVIISDKGAKDSLIVSESADKVHEIDGHIMASAAGILSDARLLISHIRVVAQQHRMTYDSPVDVESIIREVADIKQQYTQSPGIRPFGVSLLIAGLSGDVPKVYTSEITGNYFEYYAIAIGQNEDKIKEILRKEYKKEIKVDEAIKLGLNIFRKVLGNSYDINRFNVGVIKIDNKKLKKLNGEEIKRFG
ncbi:MAG: archaeal proteasome endopeptidase complex subunit alpha [Candidatus Woesearchaeota archaeon]